MNDLIKFFTSVFWGVDERTLLSENFDKKSAMTKRLMTNINNHNKKPKFSTYL